MVLLAAALLVGLVTGVLAAGEVTRRIEVTFRGIAIRVDDQAIAASTEPFVVADSGRVMIPARDLAEALGAAVEWDDATSTVHVYSADFVAAEPQAGGTRFRVPARGLSLSLPPGYLQVEFPGAVLAVQDAAGHSGAVVLRWDAPELPLDQLVDSVLAAMGAAAGAPLSVQSQAATVAGAPGFDVRARSVQPAVEYHLRLTERDGSVWVVAAYYSEGAGAEARRALDGALESFRLDGGRQQP